MKVSRQVCFGILILVVLLGAVLMVPSYHAIADDRGDDERRTVEVEVERRIEVEDRDEGNRPPKRKSRGAERRGDSLLDRAEAERRERDLRREIEEHRKVEQRHEMQNRREAEELREIEERRAAEHRHHMMQAKRHHEMAKKHEQEERERHHHRFRMESEMMELELHRKKLELEMIELELEAKQQQHVNQSDKAALDALNRVRARLEPDEALEFLTSMIDQARSPVIRQQLRLMIADLHFSLDRPEPALDQLRALIVK